MLPNGVLSAEPVPATFLEPVNTSSDPLIDVEMGGVALSDPSAGLQLKLWTARYEAGEVIVSATGVPDTVLFQRAGITELALAFDQNMRPFVAFTDAGGSAFWWYDTQQAAQVFSAYLPAGSTNLRCTMDDKRPGQSGNSDIILAYIRNNALFYRQQRDRFETEYLLASSVNAHLVNVGMNTANRLQFHLRPTQ